MTNPTDTNQASKLFELCEEVYGLHPFWAGTDMIYGKEQDGDWEIMPLTLSIPKRNRIPLYTSDYLLEKLPVCVVEKYQQVDNEWAYSAKSYSYEKHMRLTEYEETPLKALLKLTIALSEAGELK